MNKKVISAIILLIICIPIIYIGGLPFYIFGLLVALLGFKEILNLFIKDKWSVEITSYICFLALIGTNLLQNNFGNILNNQLIGIIFLVFFTIMLFNYRDKKYNINQCFTTLGITLFLGIAFSVMIIVRNMSLNYFIYLFLITITTDIFAYFVGSLFGKHKINEISPNKSWEGALGGTLFGSLISSIFYLFMINQDINIFLLLGITLFLTIIGQLGDLFFSYIKRHFNIKDFSNLIPGHGGILDRLDSFIFVMLAFTYFVTYL